VAAGLPALYQSGRSTLQKMGVIRGLSTWIKVNQKQGFDCQSCAWPNPDNHRHVFEFCENGVKAIADEATKKRISPEFFSSYSITDLKRQSDYWLGLQGRLNEPMVKRQGSDHYEPISWGQAFQLIATELNSLTSPNEGAFYTSGRTSNEAAFLYQLFVRQFGTNNLPDCSNMCHESSGAAMNDAIGIGKGCVTLDDFEKTDAIFIIGQNPGTNHPRMLTALEHAKKRGAKIVAINPLPETGLMRVVNPKLNRSHLITGEIALILPCLGRTETDRKAEGEQFVTVEDSMGVISSSRGHLEPASEQLLSEPAIIAGLARAVLCDRTTVPWEELIADYGRIRDRIERVIPGFEYFNQRIARDIFYLPNPARDQRRFPTDVGKAKFTVHAIEPNELQPGQYIMMTIRTHDQFNTTIYGLDDRYRGVYNGRRVIFLNPEDLTEAGLERGQLVDLTSHFKGRKRVAEYFLVTPFEIPRGCAATYFPETNVLVPIDSVAERSNTPTSKFVVITVSPSQNVKAGVARIQAAAHEASEADTHQPAGPL
jgi:anaerobic selenocysteine-containing dehydrogenase